MSFNPSNYLIIGSESALGQGNYYIHEREVNKDGKPGKIVTFADGNGDVKEVAKTYVEKGFDPKKIVINGQPATDVFQKSGETSAQKSYNENLRNFGKAALLMSNPLVYMGLTAHNPDMALKLPAQNKEL